MAAIMNGAAMQIQYDNDREDQLENAASGLCNAALHKLFPITEFIITGEYYFMIGLTRFYADYIVERIWPTGHRAIILVVEAK